jgi:hypothetical protein
MHTFHFSSSFVYSSEFSPKGVAYTRNNSENENEAGGRHSLVKGYILVEESYDTERCAIPNLMYYILHMSCSR